VTRAQPVLVIGGTRGTGLLIARRLKERGSDVRILARDPIRATTILGSDFEIVAGDITKEATLPAALRGVNDIIFTAGRRSGRPVLERHIRATEFYGVVNTLAAARHVGFAGRFLYMTASGVTSRSFWSFSLNLYKGNTLVWRRRAEDEIRASDVGYTIIRAAWLSNAEGGRHAIDVTQHPLPLSPRYRIARADVADVFVAALDHPRAVRATFEIAWGSGKRRPLAETLDNLVADASRGGASNAVQ
jgi:uncharacterized protein YbjT (DUF2867 family)